MEQKLLTREDLPTTEDIFLYLGLVPPKKRFTEAELACEYWSRFSEYHERHHMMTQMESERREKRHQTLFRFLMTEHYDEEKDWARE